MGAMQGTGAWLRHGQKPSWPLDVLSPACRLPAVGREQEAMNVDFQWNFADPHVNHGSVIQWMGDV